MNQLKFRKNENGENYEVQDRDGVKVGDMYRDGRIWRLAIPSPVGLYAHNQYRYDLMEFAEAGYQTWLKTEDIRDEIKS